MRRQINLIYNVQDILFLRILCISCMLDMTERTRSRVVFNASLCSSRVSVLAVTLFTIE